MRLVDAEHLKRWIMLRWESCVSVGYDDVKTNEILEQIDRELTIKPEIIRCKDCMYYDKNIDLDEFPGQHFCPMMEVVMKPDGFCSEGDKDESRNEDDA